MEYGFLWRTKNLVKLLINKGELLLSKVKFTTSFWGMKRNSEEEFLFRQAINLMDQARDHINYGISMLTKKTIVTDHWITVYNLVDAQLTEDIGRLTLKIKEYYSNKEET